MKFSITWLNLVHGLDFLLFGISFVANLIIFVLVPNADLHDFAFLYLAGNSIFSFIIYSQFTGAININSIKFIYYVCLFFLFTLALGPLPNTAIYFFYPYFYLIADHLVSQKFSLNIVRFYRFLSISTVVLFFENNLSFTNDVLVRTIFFALISLACINNSSNIKPLSINSRWKFVLFCYLSYTVPLFVIVHISRNPAELKVWYVLTQLGIAILLKYYDFSSRGAGINQFTFLLCAIFSFAIPFIGMAISFSLQLFFVYFFGLIIILYAGKYVEKI